MSEHDNDAPAGGALGLRRRHDPDMKVAPDDILVLRNAGPLSAAAMPEAGYPPIPKKLSQAGVKDLARSGESTVAE